MSARRTSDRESGASLILVLVALTVFGLLVPILGQFGSANGVSGYIVKGLRFDRYVADNGVHKVFRASPSVIAANVPGSASLIAGASDFFTG